MSHQKRDEGSEINNHEERQAGNSGRLSGLWHENVQDRQELALLRYNRQNSKGLDIPDTGMSSPFILRITLFKRMCDMRQ
jgi:hypothetical protein